MPNWETVVQRPATSDLQPLIIPVRRERVGVRVFRATISGFRRGSSDAETLRLLSHVREISNGDLTFRKLRHNLEPAAHRLDIRP